jgi:hypothetical protein
MKRVIGSIHIAERGGTLHLVCQADGNHDLEMWGVPGRIQLLEEALGRPIHVESEETAARQGASRRAGA